MRPSVTSCRVTRTPLAPNARRTDSSERRASARANNKFAIFAQTITRMRLATIEPTRSIGFSSFRVVEWILGQREDAHATSAVLVRELDFEPPRRRIDLRLAGGDADAGFEPRKSLDPSGRAVFELVARWAVEHGLLRRRGPELHRVPDEGAEETFGCHADDRVRHPIVPDGRADDASAASEAILPEPVADHRDRMAVAADVLVR